MHTNANQIHSKKLTLIQKVWKQRCNFSESNSGRQGYAVWSSGSSTLPGTPGAEFDEFNQPGVDGFDGEDTAEVAAEAFSIFWFPT